MHYEGLLRVPLIVRGPDVPEGRVLDEPVSTMDIPPTLLDLGRAEPMLTQHVQALSPYPAGETPQRRCAMNEWELLEGRVGVALSLRTVRTRTHKLTMDMRSGNGEMYDLVADPHETVNLFNDPAHASVQAELEAFLAERPDDIGPNGIPVGPA